MPAPTAPAPHLTAEATHAISTRLADLKGRTDIEVLAVLAVAPGRLYGRWTSEPGLTLTVAFTYTTGRRQRRTADVTWALTTRTSPLDHLPGVPDAIWGLLNHALTTT